MRIATWNVNGIRAREAQVLEWIGRDQPDVFCLQEIKARPEQVPASLKALPGYRAFWHGHGGYSGVCVAVRTGFFPGEVQFSHPPFDRETRIVEARVGDVSVASVYVPNGGKDFAAKMEFLAQMEAYVRQCRAEKRALVICGDINVTRTDQDVHPKERRADVIGQRPDERALFERVLASGLVDVGRTLAPDDESLFTWWAPWRGMRAKNIGWRLDYVLAPPEMAGAAKSCPVLNQVGTSDHAPVMAEFA